MVAYHKVRFGDGTAVAEGERAVVDGMMEGAPNTATVY